MTTCILDASVVSQRFVPDTYSTNARALFKRLPDGDQFVIPEFCYDSVYIVMGQTLNLPLITADQKQACAAAEGVTVKPITDFV